MKFILQYMFKNKKIMAGGLTLKIIGTIMDLFIPLLLSYILDDIIPLGDLSLIIWYGIVMVFCAILGFTFNVIGNRIAARVARQSSICIRHDLFHKIMNISSSDKDKATIPSLVSRMTTDSYNVYNIIGMIQRLGIRAPVLLIGGIILTFTLNTQIALVMVATLPAIILIIFFVTKVGVPLFTKVQKKVDNLVLVVRENISGMKVIKALNKKDYERNRFDNVNDEAYRAERKANLNMAIINPVLNVIMNVGLIAVIYVGAYEVNKGNIESGKVIAFLTYFTIILNAMLSITRMFINISKATASAKRIKEIIDIKDTMTIEDKEYGNNFLEFRNVSFSYNGIKNNLDNINFSLKKGESLGIIGATGSGKSTLISLLLRLYDPTSGSIFLDNENIKGIPNDVLKQHFGVTFQNDIIFGETILENIDFGRHLDFKDIENAVGIAQAKDFVDTEGYSKVLSEKGSNLSGGQKQRILLARAIALKPNILILDDCSSALDFKTEKSLWNAIKSELPNTTLIVISSRISSVKDLSKIIVLEDGKMIGMGNHESLLNNCDIYKEIKISQMGE